MATAPALRVDLNADLGEGFGRYTVDGEDAVLRLVTSASVACGFHAGDPRTIDAAVGLAREHGVRVGAHPGFPDRVGFGRRMMACGRRRSPPTSSTRSVPSRRSAAGTGCGCSTSSRTARWETWPGRTMWSPMPSSTRWRRSTRN